MYIELFLTIICLLGLILFYREEMKSICLNVKNKIICWLIGFKSVEDTDYIEASEAMTGSINDGIRRLLAITLGIGTKKGVFLFWTVTLLPPAVLYVLGRGMLSGCLMFASMLLFNALPLTLILVHLQGIRVRSSKEGKILLGELLDNYKINYYNMQQAVEITALTIEDAPVCKKLLFNLSKGINRTTRIEDIRVMLDDFKYAIGTSWANILTDNMYFALTSGIRVEVAMEDLVSTISKAEEVEERAKRENNDSELILKYLAPCCYFLTVAAAIKIFGLTWNEFLNYQFATTAGVGWFMIIVITYICSLLMKFFLTQRKLDI
ncbi:MAG: hypothetical protein PUE18_05070 [Firmicutes bacterium]|nr:hypothetical protein [Bacillota bacterium]